MIRRRPGGTVAALLGAGLLTDMLAKRGVTS